jgi:hypothetical protein
VRAGEFPDNLKSYKVVNSKTIVLTLTGSFNPTWFTYDQLTQITPLPVQAWDKTSATGAVGNYDQTPSGAKAVFNFLTAQSKDIATYRLQRRLRDQGPVAVLAEDRGQPAVRARLERQAERRHHVHLAGQRRRALRARHRGRHRADVQP